MGASVTTLFRREVHINAEEGERFSQMKKDLEDRGVEHTVLDVEIVEARDLIAMDTNGLSDPYCKIEHEGLTSTTPIIFKNLNPKWEHKVKIIEKSNTDLIVSVWDNDMFGNDDFIGSTAVEVPRHGELTDRWYTLNNPEHSRCGELRVRVIKEWGGNAYWINEVWDKLLIVRDGACPRQVRDFPEPPRPPGSEKVPLAPPVTQPAHLDFYSIQDTDRVGGG